MQAACATLCCWGLCGWPSPGVGLVWAASAAILVFMKLRSMNLLTSALALTLASAALPAHAQSLAEMVTVTAIQGTLNSMSVVSLPTGSSFVKNPQYAQKAASDWLGATASKWKDFELYIARGVVRGLATSYAQNMATEFAVKGFFAATSKTTTVAGEERTQTEYANMDTGAAMLIVITKKSDGVYILVAKKK
jgi:hypothetical protein